MTEMQMKIRFGENFKRFRKHFRLKDKKEWTYKAIEKKLNVTLRAIQKWEAGESFPTAYMLVKIADMYGCSIDVLVGRKPFNISEEENSSWKE